DLADRAFPAGGLGEREVGLDLVAVAAAVLLLDQVAGLGQLGDDAVGAALGDAHPGPASATAMSCCIPASKRGLAFIPGGQARHLLSDRPLPTGRRVAEQPPDLQPITPRRPPAGASASRRSYRLCTRREGLPHDGHATSPARARARMRSNPP